MELGPQRPSLLWFREPNSIISLVYVDPLGNPDPGEDLESRSPNLGP